jgi:hypothetical protein
VTSSYFQRADMRESNHYVADPEILRATGVVALLAIGTIHFLQIVPTLQQTPLLGLGYIALIVASVLVAAWLVVANDARAWAAAGLISAAVLAGYAFTRVVGTTFDNQDVGNWACTLGLASLFVEATLLALSGAAVALNRAKASAPSIAVRSKQPRDGRTDVEIDTAQLAELEVSATQ